MRDVGPEILEDLTGRDEEPMRAFVLARRDALLTYAYLLTGDRHAAEDVVQIALVRTALAWPRVRHQGDPEGYVRTAIARTAINTWRTRIRRREQVWAQPPERPGPDAVGEIDERDAMWRALSALPPRRRAVLVLRYYEGLSEAEIALVLGCSRGTVKSQASKALAQLRSGLSGADGRA
ncbi:MAG: SigE family RNA polymerase sigma factor [Kineosporiaceae bacterium]